MLQILPYALVFLNANVSLLQAVIVLSHSREGATVYFVLSNIFLCFYMNVESKFELHLRYPQTEDFVIQLIILILNSRKNTIKIQLSYCHLTESSAKIVFKVHIFIMTVSGIFSENLLSCQLYLDSFLWYLLVCPRHVHTVHFHFVFSFSFENGIYFVGSKFQFNCFSFCQNPEIRKN